MEGATKSTEKTERSTCLNDWKTTDFGPIHEQNIEQEKARTDLSQMYKTRNPGASFIQCYMKVKST